MIDWFVLVALLGGPRLAYRLFKDRGLDHVFERFKHQSVPVLLNCAKGGANTFIREMRRDPRVIAGRPALAGRPGDRSPWWMW